MRRFFERAKKKINRAYATFKKHQSTLTYKSFLDEQNNFQLNMIGSLIFVIPTGQVLFLISAFISGFSTTSIIVTFISMIVVVVVIYSVFHWKLKCQPHIPIILSTILLLWQLTAMEILREIMKEIYLTPITNIYVGVFLGVTNSFITVSGVKWQYMAAYYISYSVLWYLRMTPGDPRPESKYEQITFSLLMFSGVIFLFRKKQLIEFGNYQAKKEFEENMQNFKILIKEVLPEHIIIVDRSRQEIITALFLNDSARKRFRIRNQEHLKYILQNLKVEDYSATKLNDLSESVMKRQRSKASLKNIFELVNNMGFEEGEGSFNDFKTFQVRMNQDISSSTFLDVGGIENEENIFELKIGKTSWEANKNAIILILTDISHTHRITKLKVQHQKKDQFLSTFTHEIRTPINSIIGMVQTALDMTEDLVEVQKHLQIALSSAKALILKVGDLLDLSAINNNNVQLKLERTNLTKIVNDVIEINHHSIIQRGLTLIKDYRIPNDVFIFTDKLRFQQILMNLLTNAIKFTSSGFIRIGISESSPSMVGINQRPGSEEFVYDLPVGRRILLIEVEDSGKGMDDESINHLFKLFEKFESVGKTTGVGLGLAVSQKLLSLLTDNYFEIGVKSTLGSGSTFSFHFFKEQKETSSPKVGEPRQHHPFRYFSLPNEEKERLILSQEDIIDPRILVVDDDPMNILVVTNYLKSMGGIHYATAGNGAEAIEKIIASKQNKEYFHVILMDLNMPVMNGLEATKEIMGMISDGEIPSTKVVALTANSTAYNENLCFQLGMTDFLSKPLYKEEFLKKMQGFIKKQNR